MCGRFIQITDPEKIRVLFAEFDVETKARARYRPRYNISPTAPILTVVNHPTPTLTLTRWGLVPFWAKDPAIGNMMINARAETLSSKPSFREPFRKRRCLILADGFYEWTSSGTTRIPFFVCMKNREPFAMAGLWDLWRNTMTGENLASSTIITTEPNALIAQVHNRMPVILPREMHALWLSSDPVPEADLAACLRPYPARDMEAYSVSRMVNTPTNDSPACISPVRGV
ncbi:MAG TPA: SOS response-associated peptidase [Deltaproteobacteria bacterium]|nr:SOS response-associated peptidase [Deltaproteobacteria bacterium]